MRASLQGRITALQAGQLVPFLTVSLEVLWSYRWLAWISGWESVGWSRPPLSLGGAVVLAMAAQVLTRLALGYNWALSRARLVFLSAAVVLLVMVAGLDQGSGYHIWDLAWAEYALGHVSALVAGLVFGVYLLWRGISVGREDLPLGDLYPRFAFGLGALVLLQVLWGTSPGPVASRPEAATGGLYMAAYFAIGLLALALANLQAIQGQMRRHEEPSGTFYRHWVVLVAGLTLGIVALSLALASPFSFDLVAWLLQPLGLLADWLLTAFLYVVVYPLALLATALFYLFRLIIHWLRGAQAPPPPPPPDSLGLTRDGQGLTALGIPPEVVLALKWGLVALLAFLAFFFLARALSRYWRDRGEEIEEVSESLWSLEAFKNDLRSLLQGWLRWFQRRRPGQEVASPPMAVTESDAPDRLFDVRELYRGLLWEGRRQGLPRRPAETPYEYRGRLEQRVTPGLPAVQAITEAYVSERYGDRTVTGPPLTVLNRQWRRLLSLWRGSAGAPGSNKRGVR